MRNLFARRMKEFKEQLEKDHLDEIAMYKKMANDLRTKLDQFQKEIDEKQVGQLRITITVKELVIQYS